MKICTKCHESKSLNQFNKDLSKLDGLHSHCKSCMSKNMKRWWNNNKEHILKERAIKILKSRIARKIRVLNYYSLLSKKPQCVICGETRLPCLSIDHINGGGNKHRKSLGCKTSDCFYMWLERNNYPSGYQTLCMNCQWVKKFKNKEF